MFGIRLSEPIRAFKEWAGTTLASKGGNAKADAKASGNTAVIGGQKQGKRPPRLKDNLKQALAETEAKAAMEIWTRAETSARSLLRPRRDLLIAVYRQIMKDNYLTGQITTLKNKVLAEPYVLVDAAGNEQPQLMELVERPWFIDFLGRILDTDFWGHTLINFDYPGEDGEFYRFDVIPRNQVVPEWGQVLLNVTDEVGVPFRGIDADYTRLLIEVRLFDEEGRDALGLLNKAAPEVIWKRYSRGDWSRRSEKFGMPMITLKTSAVEEAELSNREKSLANMGANGWAIIDSEEEIDIKESSNQDGSKIYKALSDFCNDELAYLITGQTMTSQDGASKSQGEVHERVQENYVQARMRFVAQYVNYSLFPFLKLWGYPLEGIQFKWLKWVNEAKAAADGPQPKPGTDPEKDTPKAPNADKKKDKKGKNLKLATPSFSLAGADCSAPATTGRLELAAADTNLLKLFNDVLKKLHTDRPKLKKMVKSPEFLAMYRETAAKLSEGLEEGYGKKIANVKWNSPDATLLAKLTESLYVFSANKSYTLLTELNGLLVDGDKVRPYADFEAEALALYDDYNVNWLRTEYDTAIATGQMSAKWVGFQEDKDSYFLKYTTANDDRVRPTHAELDGVTLPVDDAFWLTHYPPLGWRCRCNVVRVPRAGRIPTPAKDVAALSAHPPEFGHNAGKTGVVFPDSHTYNDIPEGAAELLRNQARADSPKPKKPND